jgi:iron(III) transport system permease protein
MLIVLEVSKELSLVLFLRPYGYETLATKAFTYANDEKILESIMYSLTIVIIFLIALGMVQFLKEKNARIKKR